MIKRFFTLLFLCLFLGLNVTNAEAQTYRFQVPKSETVLFINADGTASVEYYIDFLNDPSADPIDFVDIGLPNSNYANNSIQADIDGVAITDIAASPYVKPGIALGLGDNAIQPGRAGRVHVYIGKIERMIYPSTENESEPYASFQFQPNYFGSEYVSGQTDLTMRIIMPPGLKTEEPRYYPPSNWPGNQEPESGLTTDGDVFYEWRAANASSSAKYVFGGAFPARLIPDNTIVRAPAVTVDGDTVGCLGFGFCLTAFIGLTSYLSIVGSRKRRMEYLPPKIAIEGHGVKRGLTSVEAAVLLQTPPDRVLTMILFSVIKKGAAAVKTKDPLELTIVEPQPEGLRPYELEFLAAFKETKKDARRKGMQEVMIGLVKSVTQSMKGFSAKETKQYYQDIMTRAWQQVEAADTPDVKMQKFDEYMGWTMLDRRFDNRTQDVFRTGPVYIPTWWHRWDPTFTGSSPVVGTAGHNASPVSAGMPSGSGSTTINLPQLPGADFAASMVNGIQNFSSNVIGDLGNFTSAVTNKTNPVPKSSYSSRSSSRGGGGGCACACACAGCACACAGGGR